MRCGIATIRRMRKSQSRRTRLFRVYALMGAIVGVLAVAVSLQGYVEGTGTNHGNLTLMCFGAVLTVVSVTIYVAMAKRHD